MGIPRFYYWLRYDRYGSQPVTPSELWETTPQNDGQVHNLFVDFNAYPDCTNPEEIEDETIVQHVISELRDSVLPAIMQQLNPQKLIYFAADGVPPLAKINDQRCSRSGKLLGHSNYPAPDEINAAEISQIKLQHRISPGSTFMSKLSGRFQALIIELLKTAPTWENLEVIFSDETVPGEGEHKIMDFIRAQSEDFRNGGRHVILSKDADFLMIALLDPLRTNHNAQIARLLPDRGNEIERINIHNLGDAIYRKICQEMLVAPVRENALNDFVLIFFTVGNDFVPPVFGFSVQSGVGQNIEPFDEILRAYRDYYDKYNKPIRNGTVQDWQRLREFYCILYDKVENPSASAPLRKRLNEWYNRSTLPENRKTRYYGQHFPGINLQMHNATKPVRRDFVHTLFWIFQYYSEGIPDNDWTYPYHYSPLIDELAAPLGRNRTLEPDPTQFLFPHENTENSLGTAVPPLVHLALSLPSESDYVQAKCFQQDNGATTVAENRVGPAHTLGELRPYANMKPLFTPEMRRNNTSALASLLQREIVPEITVPVGSLTDEETDRQRRRPVSIFARCHVNLQADSLGEIVDLRIIGDGVQQATLRCGHQQ